MVQRQFPQHEYARRRDTHAAFLPAQLAAGQTHTESAKILPPRPRCGRRAMWRHIQKSCPYGHWQMTSSLVSGRFAIKLSDIIPPWNYEGLRLGIRLAGKKWAAATSPTIKLWSILRTHRSPTELPCTGVAGSRSWMGTSMAGNCRHLACRLPPASLHHGRSLPSVPAPPRGHMRTAHISIH